MSLLFAGSNLKCKTLQFSVSLCNLIRENFVSHVITKMLLSNQLAGFLNHQYLWKKYMDISYFLYGNFCGYWQIESNSEWTINSFLSEQKYFSMIYFAQFQVIDQNVSWYINIAEFFDYQYFPEGKIVDRGIRFSSPSLYLIPSFLTFPPFEILLVPQ